MEFFADGRQRLSLRLRQKQADVQSRQQADHRERHKAECSEPTLENKGSININPLEQPLFVLPPPFCIVFESLLKTLLP